MNKYEWVDTITLPERDVDDMCLKDCHICGHLMAPCVITADYMQHQRLMKSERIFDTAGVGLSDYFIDDLLRKDLA